MGDDKVNAGELSSQEKYFFERSLVMNVLHAAVLVFPTKLVTAKAIVALSKGFLWRGTEM